MTTTPTQLPVPSEKPQDLKFNAGKIDEFVTSMGWTYTDRFGNKHYTISGINYLAQQVMSAFGYITLSGVSFTTGATISNPNEVLFNEGDNEYYKWTGSFSSGSKVVPANSTPESTGGVGAGKWLGVSDATLRGELSRADGERLVGCCPDIATLRTIEPQNANQRITVLGYYSDTPGMGGGTFTAFSSSESDDGVNIFVTPRGKRWKRTGSHIDIPVENGGMIVTGTAEQNSDAMERLTACLPKTGGTLRLNGFYNIKYGAIVPPRVTMLGVGMDACGLTKTGNDIKTVPDRMWQGVPHSFSKDFIAAVDMDSDTSGNLDGNQTRSIRIIGLSLLCTAPTPSEFGIYSAISYDVRLEDLYVHNVKTGYRTSDSWLQSVNNVMIQDCQDGYVVDVAGTSFNLNNLYIRGCSRHAIKMKNVTYSALTCCVPENVVGTAYVFLSCAGITLNGCAVENVTGSIIEANQSYLIFNGFRTVSVKDSGVQAVIITQSNAVFNGCLLSEFEGVHTSKYYQFSGTTINFNASFNPDPSRVLWGNAASTVNYSNSGGNYSIWGTNSWTATGYMVNGIANVYGDVPPDISVTQFGEGARWELLRPVAGSPYKWIYFGSGVWKVAGSVTA